MPWRPARIKGLPPEAAGIINQLLRETNGRIDNLLASRTPRVAGTNSKLVFGSIAAGATQDRTAVVIGAKATHACHASPQVALQAGLTWSAWPTAQNQVSVRVANSTSGAIVPNLVTWNITCT
jgi:hypothetical protein